MCAHAGRLHRHKLLACRSAEACGRLDQCLELLFAERNRQWHRNGDYVQSLMGEFNTTLSDLSASLIEKDLLERQSMVLEQIILSHENVTQWKDFVQEILIAVEPVLLRFCPACCNWQPPCGAGHRARNGRWF